ICVSRHNEVAGVSLGFPANLEPSSSLRSTGDKPETLESVDLGEFLLTVTYLLGEVEQKILKRQIKQVEEDEQTLADLESAIPQCNGGFKMFKQTGYTLGCGSGRVEPMGVEIRRRREDELMVDFGCRVKERMLDQLENKEVVVVEKEDDIDDDIDDEDEEVIKKEDLHEILIRLSDNFRYCLFFVDVRLQYGDSATFLNECQIAKTKAVGRRKRCG
ncbi:hypothetical protein Tco_0053588, partial [Tanacetum coccineum]